MAGKVRIVTDSSAQFLDPGVVERHKIAVVPLSIQIDSRTYREGIDIDSASFFRLLADSRSAPTLLPPSVDQFSDTYMRLHRETDQVLSIHLSRSMHSTWQNARTATQSLLGRCEIAVLDSQTTSVGLGLLVEAAAHLAEQTNSLDEIVHQIRAMVSRIYAIFYVESLAYLQHNGLVSESQAILGGMLGIKPFLTIEEGQLITMEKVRTRPQAIDKLVEFVTEFTEVDNLVILQNTPHVTDQTRMLRERLTLEYSARSFPIMVYGPSLGTFIGPDATGIVVFEKEGALIEDSEGEDDLWPHG